MPYGRVSGTCTLDRCRVLRGVEHAAVNARRGEVRQTYQLTHWKRVSTKQINALLKGKPASLPAVGTPSNCSHSRVLLIVLLRVLPILLQVVLLIVLPIPLLIVLLIVLLIPLMIVLLIVLLGVLPKVLLIVLLIPLLIVLLIVLLIPLMILPLIVLP